VDLAPGGPVESVRGAGRYRGDSREHPAHRPLAVPTLKEPTLKADPFAQLKLLDVQELDARTDQLRHQRANLPELAEIAELEQTRARLADQLRDGQIQVDDLTAEQQKVDADVEQVKARRARDRDRMDKGLISNPKDLERMQQELVSLERRITTLEDDELEVMERLEEAQRSLESLSGQLQAADARLAELAKGRDEKAASIDEELTRIARERGPAADGLPADLVTLYERLREQKGGVGAAALRARECGGCRLTLDNAELAVIRSAPPDEVIRCEECQRILVRTPERGL
jgi:predicted  nucleic acid-binding Zn-ribbon protein